MSGIRAATVGDIPAIKHCDMVSFEFNYSDRIYNDIISEGVSFVAVHDGRVCGYVMCTLTNSFDTIMTLAVLPEYRRYGYGKRLLEMVLSEISTPTITLTVHQDNVPAIRLYEKYGFQFTDQENPLLNTRQMVLNR